MSAFERLAAQRVLDAAKAAGLSPPPLSSFIHQGGSYPARKYADEHPDDDDPTVPVEARFCCDGVIHRGLDSCTCWTPEYELEQTDPRPPSNADDLHARNRMCDDCAFRPGSPERSTTFEEETLFELAMAGTPFWCHDGMRRPARWTHPVLGTIDGDTADWHPPIRDAIPYRADGAPALLCAGWTAVAARELVIADVRPDEAAS